MIQPQKPTNEKGRLRELRSYAVLDTLPEEEYDDITRLAAQICQTPISLISLLDENRQWFKSKYGIDASETSRDVAFCAHAINNPDHIFTVEDSRTDERFWDNPLVTEWPQVISYTGISLVSPNGYALGTLCVIDRKPKVLTQEQQHSLQTLANQVVRLFELRRTKSDLEKTINMLESKNRELQQFDSVVAHDLRSPLSSIIGIIDLLKNGGSGHFDSEASEMIDLIDESAQTLNSLIIGILEHSRSNKTLTEHAVNVNLTTLIERIISVLDAKREYHFIYPIAQQTICINKTALEQILINLISNAIKYNNKEHTSIEVGFSNEPTHYQFYVKDNGPGINEKHKSKIFDIFEVGSGNDRFGRRGHGIGLCTVKELVEGQGGTISVESSDETGTTFSFSIGHLAD